MPVPVPRLIKPSAHPVNKPVTRAPGHTQFTHNLPVPPSGLPPSYGTLPSWKRTQHRDQASVQDFLKGLTAADNASVIKGAHAEACIPPMRNRAQQKVVAGSDFARNYRSVKGDTIGSGREVPQLDSNVMWSSSAYPAYDGGYSDGADLHQNTYPTDLDSAYSYHLKGFTPIFEDSPGSASGGEDGSSPMEPLTPFGDFVDRAVATTHSYPSLNNHYDDRGLVVEQDAYQAAPVFPSIADVPKQQDPIQESSAAPSATVNYQKLSEPLAEWVATYVWKVCTTGFSLPPGFAQPGYVINLHS